MISQNLNNPTEISKNIFIGGLASLNSLKDEEWAFVHATQTVHYKIFGWDRKNNKPPKNHPNYIFFEDDNRLSLNWVDGGAHLYNWSGVETFIKVSDFIEKKYKTKKVLVHCDLGMSRSPTLVLLFLAKRLESICSDSFENAQIDFMKLYPQYNPGGIAKYVSHNWQQIK